MMIFAFLVLLAQLLISTSSIVNADGPPKKFNIGQTSVEILLAQQLKSPSPDVIANALLLTLPPGDIGADPHFHSGPVVGYVVEGEFLFQVKGRPIQIIPAGSMFYENNGDIHVWGGNASNSTTCKVLATVYGKPGQEILTYAKDHVRSESREEAIAMAKKN